MRQGRPKGRAGPMAAMPRLGATLRHSLTNDKEFLWDIGSKVVLICAGFMAICVVLGMIGKKLAE